MGFNDDYLDPDGFSSTFDCGPTKWRVFREKLPSYMNPMWVVWDENGEYLFPTGEKALAFVAGEMRKRTLSSDIREIQERLP